MEEEKQSIWHTNLNLAFVYIVVFLFGLVVVYAMTTVLNNKLEEINKDAYSMYQQDM